MLQKMRNAAVLAAGLAVSGMASAVEVDVSGVVTSISGAAAPIGLIGSAVLSVLVGIKVFKWVRQAM